MNSGKSKISPHKENIFDCPTYTLNSLSFQGNTLGRFAVATISPFEISGILYFRPITGMIKTSSAEAPRTMASLRMALGDP